MSSDLLVVLALLVAAIAMFIANRPRMDAVGLIMIIALPLTGVITMGEALAGFADPSIVLIAALFVIGEGLVRTGVARRLGDWLGAKAGASETRLLVLLMLTACALGAFMSSTAVVAIFIPIVLRICAQTGLSARSLMMPLSMAALISGMTTLVATAPNLVVNAEMLRQGFAGFGFFDFSPFGVPILLLAIGYMLLVRRKLAGATPDAPARRRVSLRDWVERYALPDREFRVRVVDTSPIVGRSLAELDWRAEGVNLLAVERPRRFGADLLRPQERLVLQAGDLLMMDVQSPALDAEAFFVRLQLEVLPLGPGGRYFTDRTQEVGMIEAMVPADSPLIGQTILEARMRSDLGLTAISLRRGQRVLGERLLEERLRVGDTLLLFGFWSDIRGLRADGRDLVPLGLPAEFDEVLPAPGRAIEASACLGVTILLMVSGFVPTVQAALFGCLLMGLFRCVDLASAYRAISWKTIVLIVGMLPFSLALPRTGGVDLAADALLALAGEAAPRVALALLFVVTAVIGLFISNTATAILMAPVALAVAADMGASPYPFAMIVALAASTAFMTPISSPVNTLVLGPGGYAFGDFVRIGVPFSLLVLVVSVLLVPIVFPP
jgi:di/tricarboxylate transporter